MAKIGDEVMIIKGWKTYTIIDPGKTCFGASEEDPNVDIDGDYWVNINDGSEFHICIGKEDGFTVIEEKE